MENRIFVKMEIDYLKQKIDFFETGNIFVLVATHYQQKFDSPFELIVHLPQC